MNFPASRSLEHDQILVRIKGSPLRAESARARVSITWVSVFEVMAVHNHRRGKMQHAGIIEMDTERRIAHCCCDMRRKQRARERKRGRKEGKQPPGVIGVTRLCFETAVMLVPPRVGLGRRSRRDRGHAMR